MNAGASVSLLSDMALTHMELGDVKVRLHRAQLPRLVFQKHPQLFQSGPERLRGDEREWGMTEKSKE